MKRFMSLVLTGAIALSTGVFCPAPNFSTVAEENVENDFTEVTYENVKYKKYADHVEVGKNPSNKELTEVVIPAEIDGLPVKVIGYGAFAGCGSLTSIIIPDSVTKICSVAFNGCNNLVSINIPDSVTEIGMAAFSTCSSLKSITIENPECEIYDDSSTIQYYGTIDYDSFKPVYGSFFGGIIYGQPNSTAQAYAEKYGYKFAPIGEQSSTEPENPLTYSVEGDHVVITGCNKGATEVVIPEEIEGLPVTEISFNAFFCCDGFESITIPDSVTKIGEQAFFCCKNLKSITIKNPKCEIYQNSFTICSSFGGKSFEGTIYGYPDSTAQAYAEKYDRKFVALDGQTTKTLKGDANLDGDVTIADSVAILQYLANADEYPLTEQGLKNADVLGGDGVNTEDALQIQKLDAGVIDKL